MQLGFAVWPLLRFTDEKAKMGEFANRLWLKILGWTTAAIIIVLNVKLLFDTFMPDAVLKAVLPVSPFLLPVPRSIIRRAAMYRHILIPARKQFDADETILSHIKPLARMTGAKLLLVHVADGWVARNFNQLQLAESEEMKARPRLSGKTQRRTERRRLFLRCCARARRTGRRNHQTRAREISI